MNQLFIKDLEINICGEVLSDEYSLGIYSTDASLYQILPAAVVLPKDEKDVVTAIKIANDHKISILPRGGGTSLAGQAIGESMVMDFSKYLNKILEINELERWGRVQPGVVRDIFNEEVKKYNLHFAPDPATSSRANFGGMIANNSSGTKSILYGKTIDHVLELKIALADGTILELKKCTTQQYNDIALQKTREGGIYKKLKNIIEENHEEIEARYPKVMRRVGGYMLDEFTQTDEWNLSKIIVGSEGTLATILEAKVNLEPLPKEKAVCVAHFNSFKNAIQAVQHVLPFHPSAVEVLDENLLKMAQHNLVTKELAHFLQGDPKTVLIIEFYGETIEDVIERAQQASQQLKKLGLGYAFPIFLDPKTMSDVWELRKKGLGLLAGIKKKRKVLAFIEDAAIPIEVLPDYIEEVLDVCKKYDTPVSAYAHASVGVIHVRPMLNLREADDIERFKNISRETYELVKKYGGSWSGEHGDGLVRSAYVEDFFGKKLYRAFQEVKQLFDPGNLMNPGKIVNAPPIDENLRYGVNYKDDIQPTIYNFRADKSFEEAVHLCTGVGECRKTKGGTMCPSYRATCDEEHSTRGRANALRLAMSGQFGENGLASKRMYKTLDLCLSCKACKSECPSNVDMAKLKSEVYQMRYDIHGASLRENFIKKSAQMSRLFSGSFAPIINWGQRLKLTRFLLEKIMGLEKKRTLPEYSQQPFYKWFQKNYSLEKTGKQVVLFADTYLNFHEPNIGIAATELLTACGYEVLLANVGCCQRPRISNGFLKAAKKDGTQVALRLDEFFKKNLKLVVCEPSCATALTDDLPDLLDDENLAKRMTNNVMLIEDFVAREIVNGNIEGEFVTDEKEILIHGHCHQKAIYGTRSMKTIFSKTKDLHFEEIDSGCCGMAGSFGYEKEHYQLSEKIGNEVLLPAVKALPAKIGVVACGFSCRHQIEHFTHKKPKHWVEVIKKS